MLKLESQRPGLKKGRALCEELNTCYNDLIRFPLKDLEIAKHNNVTNNHYK